MQLADRVRALARPDLTTCRIHHGVLGLAVPMIAASLLHAAQGLVDLYFVGDLGKNAVAAVGMATTAIMALATVFIGLNTATVALVSRHVGAGERTGAGHVAGQVLILTVVFSIVIGTVGYLGSTGIVKALGAEPAVVGPGADYLRIIFAGIFFLCAAFVLNGVFQ
ncbi:MAG: MATE family efflux transporter, partial [Planctomycetota bacterium]